MRQGSGMSALGEAFRDAREARGLTLSDVAEHLHIRSVYLAAIESENFASIGAPVYVRGFIRTYARFLGMDAEAAVQQFSEMVPGEFPKATASVAASSALMGSSRNERGGPSVFVVAGILLAAALLGFVGYEYYQYQSGSHLGAVAVPLASPSAAEATELPQTEATAQPALSNPASPIPVSAAGAAPDGITFHLTQRAWLRIVVDGKNEMTGIFPAGTYRQFTGAKASVRTGNAGGVDVTVGGKHLGPLGAVGDVVERSFNLKAGEAP